LKGLPATVDNLKNIVGGLLPAHVSSGCDTVCMRHGIRKTKGVKSNECSLHLLGEVNASTEDIAIKATAFMYRCYNISEVATMTEARIKARLAKTGSLH